MAISIIEESRSLGAMVAATTHYAELKVYAMKTPGVENASCEFDVETLRPTYRLLIGAPGRSNAFAISERLGIDRELIERANEFVSTENIRFENVVDSLEESRLSMEKEKSEAEKIRQEYEEKLALAEKRLAENGKNKLKEGKKKTMFQRVMEQLSDPMIIILIIAAVISMFLGEMLEGRQICLLWKSTL